MAQPGSARRSGRRGRGFKSRYPDHLNLKPAVSQHDMAGFSVLRVKEREITAPILLVPFCWVEDTRSPFIPHLPAPA